MTFLKNYFNHSERFENELNAGLLFFPYGSLYAFLMSTMALEILSSVPCIHFIFGKHSMSNNGTWGAASQLPPLILPSTPM